MAYYWPGTITQTRKLEAAQVPKNPQSPPSPLPVLLLVIQHPERSRTGEEFAFAVAVACSFACHSGAKRRNLLLHLPLPLPVPLLVIQERSEGICCCRCGCLPFCRHSGANGVPDPLAGWGRKRRNLLSPFSAATLPGRQPTRTSIKPFIYKTLQISPIKRTLYTAGPR